MPGQTLLLLVRTQGVDLQLGLLVVKCAGCGVLLSFQIPSWITRPEVNIAFALSGAWGECADLNVFQAGRLATLLRGRSIGLSAGYDVPRDGDVIEADPPLFLVELVALDVVSGDRPAAVTHDSGVIVDVLVLQGLVESVRVAPVFTDLRGAAPAAHSQCDVTAWPWLKEPTPSPMFRAVPSNSRLLAFESSCWAAGRTAMLPRLAACSRAFG